MNDAHMELIKFVVDVCSILSTNLVPYLVVDLLLVGPILIEQLLNQETTLFTRGTVSCGAVDIVIREGSFICHAYSETGSQISWSHPFYDKQGVTGIISRKIHR